MQNLKHYAKGWISGVGVAVTAYLGTWTDDPRILGVTALVTAVAVVLVPNDDTPSAPGPVDQRQPNYD